MKKSIRIFLSLTIIITALIVGIRCAKEPAQGKVIKIGAILPMTGELSLFGQWLKEGIEIAAFKEQVEIIYADNRNQASQTVSNFQKLITADKVQGIITTRTPMAFALTPLASANHIPTVFTFADLPENNETCIVNYHFPTTDEISLIAKAIEKVGKNAVVLTVNDEFGGLASKIFTKEFGGEVVYQERFNPAEREFRNLITKIPPSADFIFLVAYEQNFVSLIRQLNEKKITLPIVGPNTLTVFLHLVSNDLTMPVYVTMSLYDAGMVENEELYRQFERKFQESYNRKPNMVNAEAYEATKYLIDLFKNESSENICEVMSISKSIDSIFGTLKVNSNGQIHFPLAFVKLQDDQRDIIQVWNPKGK